MSNKFGFIKVFKKEFAGSFRLIPLIVGGMVTPLFIFIIFGLKMGNNHFLVDGFEYKQYIISGTILFQLVYATFYQSSYATFFSSNVTQTMDELLTSPLSSKDILIGRIANTSIIGVMISIPLLCIMILLSDIEFSIGYLLFSIVYLIMMAIIFSLLGTLLGLIVSNEFSLINFANAIVIPLVFLSDSFIKLSDNKIVNYILYISPIKVANDGIRSCLLAHKVDFMSLGIVLAYTILYSLIIYKVFEVKSRQ